MFIERKSVFDIPKDAVLITEKEALDHYQENIFKWKNKWDVWPFKWSVPILGGVFFFTNYSMISYYRNRLKLGDKGKIVTLLIASTVPGFLVGLLHNSLVTPNILLQKECQNCVYLKAAVIQGGSFLAYSCIGTPTITFTSAIVQGTYPVPGFSSKAERKGTWELYLKFTNRVVPRIIFCTILNVAAAYYLTYKQYSSFTLLNQKLYERELELKTKVRKLKTEMQIEKADDQTSGLKANTPENVGETLESKAEITSKKVDIES